MQEYRRKVRKDFKIVRMKFTVMTKNEEEMNEMDTEIGKSLSAIECVMCQSSIESSRTYSTVFAFKRVSNAFSRLNMCPRRADSRRLAKSTWRRTAHNH